MERDKSIDIAKGIGIILMILGHCSLFNGELRYIIFSFHMPLFFIIGGYLFSYKDYKHLITNSFKRLVIPYLLSAIISSSIWYVFADKSIGICLNEIIFAHGGPKSTMYFPTNSYIGVLWFLMALFWCRLIFNTIYGLCRENVILSFIFSFVVSYISVILGKYYINLPFGLITGTSAVIFYSIGVLFKTYKNKLNIPLNLFMVIIWMLSIYKHWTFVDMVNFGYNYYILDIISAVGGTVFVVEFSKVISKLKYEYLSYIGNVSLYILCVHHMILNICEFLDANIWQFFVLNVLIPIFFVIHHLLIKLYSNKSEK